MSPALTSPFLPLPSMSPVLASLLGFLAYLCWLIFLSYVAFWIYTCGLRHGHDHATKACYNPRHGGYFSCEHSW